MIIAVLVQEPAQRSRIVQAMRGVGIVQFCDTVDEFRDLVFRPHVGGALVATKDREGKAVAPRLRSIKNELAHLPVVAYIGPGDDLSRDVVAMVRAGADGTIFFGTFDSNHAIRETFEKARAACAASTSLENLTRHLPPRLLPIAEYCLTQATRHLGVAEIARVHGLHRKTLNTRFVRESGMQISTFIGWCRLLASAGPILQRETTLEQAVLVLDWPSVGALRGMFRRYLGIKLGQLRALGGTAFVLQRFIDALDAANARRLGVPMASERVQRIAG